MTKGFVIAIDGPVASGKGALASKLAKDLKGFYLYTGAMYRSIALLCIVNHLNLEDEADVLSVLPDLKIEFRGEKILLNGDDVTERLRLPDTASGASVVGVYPKVRQSVDEKLQFIAEQACDNGQIVVTEGRDTGTTIFPNAALKVYLTARPEIRARRRMEQYGKLGEEDLKAELENLVVRDKRDTERDTSPLPDNPEELGYFVLDNSDLDEQETLDAIKTELVNRRLIDPSTTLRMT